MRTSESDHNWYGPASRRSVLRAAGLAAGLGVLGPVVAGCDVLDPAPEPSPEPDPLTDLHQQTVELAARYDQALAAVPALEKSIGSVRHAHHEHAAVLRAILSPAPATPTATAPASLAPVGTDAKKVLAALRTAEKEAHQAAVAACLSAPAGRAVLLGEIAAARATHLEVVK